MNLQPSGPMVQYHALALMYQIRQRDRMAVIKLVQGFTKNPLRSPHAQCMLIRYIVKVLEEDDVDGWVSLLSFQFFVSFLNLVFVFLGFQSHACRAHRAHGELPAPQKRNCSVRSCQIHLLHEECHQQGAYPRRFGFALPIHYLGFLFSLFLMRYSLTVFQLFLSSPKQTLRFAAIRTLNKVAVNHTAIVSTCNLDMETLITDPNRSISTLAITTLLKVLPCDLFQQSRHLADRVILIIDLQTGNEASVDRLMKQIEGFMSEISDEFKIVVIEAIRALCIKFPAKQTNMVFFVFCFCFFPPSFR